MNFLQHINIWYVYTHLIRKEDRSEADDEFEQHYKEEFVHANKIMKRIKELGGKVIPDPKKFQKYSIP